METGDTRHTEGVLLDLSDEQRVTVPQALLASAEYDDTFGIYRKGTPTRNSSTSTTGLPVCELGKTSPVKVNDPAETKPLQNVHDENGNALSCSDIEVLDISTQSQFPNLNFEEEAEKLFIKYAKKEPSTSATPGSELLVEGSTNKVKKPFKPYLSPTMLHAKALEIQAICERVLAEASPQKADLLRWQAEDIPEMVNARSRASKLSNDVLEIFAATMSSAQNHGKSRSQDTLPTWPEGSRVWSPVREVKVTAFQGQEDCSSCPGSGPPSPIIYGDGPLNRTSSTSLSLRSLESEEPKAPTGLRRTQSCLTAPRQFLPPMASSSPRSIRADFGRSCSTEGFGGTGLQRHSSLKNTMGSGFIRSSGYGQAASKMPPPSPKCTKFAPSPVRARASISGFSSPRREFAVPAPPPPAMRPLSRGTPTKSSAATSVSAATAPKVNLNSTFAKDTGPASGLNATTVVTLPKIMRPGQTVVPPTRTTKIEMKAVQPKATGVSGVPVPYTRSSVLDSIAATATVGKRQDISNMLNKYGFRK